MPGILDKKIQEPGEVMPGILNKKIQEPGEVNAWDLGQEDTGIS